MKNYRMYNLNDKNVIFFKKTKEKWGGLSNMAGGYPIYINEIEIYTSEAIYQAMKFTDKNIQQEIIEKKSPMTAKMVAKKYKKFIRNDWEIIKVKIMRWALLLKLMFNYEKFGSLLQETDNKIIVELSHKDKFWGCVFSDEENRIVEGENILGRLLMEVREKTLHKYEKVVSPKIEKFIFLGNLIEEVTLNQKIFEYKIFKNNLNKHKQKTLI